MNPDFDRMLGCLYGVAAGDGLGVPFERHLLVGRAEIDAWSRSSDLLRHTDDTVMTLILAEHLAEGGDNVAGEDVLAGWAAEWRRDPHRGYGRGMHMLFSGELRAGQLYGGAGSLGNGAAMRTAPVAFLDLDLNSVARLARRLARLTHTHPLGADGAAVQAVAVAVALRSDTRAPLDPVAFTEQIAAAVTPTSYHLRLNQLAHLPPSATPQQIATWFGNDVTALTSVPAAIAAFLTAPDDPETAIITAIEIGGDTDTIAAMTGALAGARCGATAIPPAWITRLEARDRIADLAQRFAVLRG